MTPTCAVANPAIALRLQPSRPAGRVAELGSFGYMRSAMSETIIKTAEEGIKHLEASSPSGSSFELAISSSFTFAGKPDIIGAGMAVILDKILGMGYEPDGFEQKTGFRVYKYKKMR